MHVTEVTRDAQADSLSPDDYREIFEELRRGRSLRQFVEIIQSVYSIAYWSKVDREDAVLTRPACNELRRAVGLPDLPVTVEEALADVDANAVVYQVGDDRPGRVILVGSAGPLRMSLNGTLTAVSDTHVTTVTRRSRRVSVSIQPTLHERLNALRTARGWSWTELLEAVAKTLEA
jgi:hypothetical protein